MKKVPQAERERPLRGKLGSRRRKDLRRRDQLGRHMINPEGLGGSSGGRRTSPTADEDLERMISEMRSQGDHLKAQVLRLEDERSAELSMFGNKMQSIKDERIEFDQQYNHVLSCWRLAEERSKAYEMELRSEIGLFQEVREYLREMQQHFGNVAQEDYGAGLRIQEFEATINNLTAQYQGSAIIISQETQQEFAELRNRADRIIVEANEAIAAEDVQQFHEREIMTDEAM